MTAPATAPEGRSSEAPAAAATVRSLLAWPLAAIATGALAIRVAYVLFAKRGEPPLGDAIFYSAQAAVLADGQGFVHPFTGGPAADHPPLTAIVMAPVAAITDSITAQRLAMAVLGVAVVVAVGVLAAVVTGSRRAALVAAGLAAVSPNFWMNDGVVMAETLTALFTAAFLVAVYGFVRSPGPSTAVAVGIAAGLGTLARAEFPVLAVVAVAVAVATVGALPWRRRIALVGTAAGIAALVVAPWVIPNLVRFERTVLLSTNDGLTLVGANCDTTYGDGIGLWDLRCARPVTGDQSEQSAAYRAHAFDYAGDHLSRVPAVVAARVGRVWGVYRPFEMVWYNQGEGRDSWASRLGIWTWWATIPLAGVGVAWLRRRGTPVWPLVVPIVTVTLTAAAFYGIVRFRVPAEVTATVAAGAGVSFLFDRARRRGDPSAAG